MDRFRIQAAVSPEPRSAGLPEPSSTHVQNLPRLRKSGRADRPRRVLPAAFALFVTALALPPGDAGAAPLDRVAAVVNGDAILASEVERRLRHLVFDLRQRAVRIPNREALVYRAVDELILERLQLRLAEELGLSITDGELHSTLARIARRNDTDTAGLSRSIEAGGIPFSEFRARIHNDLLIEKVRWREVLNGIRVGDAEIDRYLAQTEPPPPEGDEYLLGHILIPRGDGEAAARARVEGILQRLQAGDDFSELARRHSSGGRAAAGGRLGWRTAATLPSLFADLVQRLTPGETSGVIESPSGFHIVKLINVRASGQSFVRQTRASHILITPTALVSDDEARERLLRLRERIRFGANFGELARSHSDDTPSAVRGGDLGWVNPGTMAPDFEAVMNRLGEGELSEPFRSTAGWHLLRVVDRRNHDNTEEVRRNRARNAVFDRKANEELTAWLAQLRDGAFIRIRVDE